MKEISRVYFMIEKDGFETVHKFTNFDWVIIALNNGCMFGIFIGIMCAFITWIQYVDVIDSIFFACASIIILFIVMMWIGSDSFIHMLMWEMS
jgi:hypothetical protein